MNVDIPSCVRTSAGLSAHDTGREVDLAVGVAAPSFGVEDPGREFGGNSVILGDAGVPFEWPLTRPLVCPFNLMV